MNAQPWPRLVDLNLNGKTVQTTIFASNATKNEEFAHVLSAALERSDFVELLRNNSVKITHKPRKSITVETIVD